MSKIASKFGQVALKNKLITKEQLEKALQFINTNDLPPERLPDVLIKLKLMSKGEVQSILQALNGKKAKGRADLVGQEAIPGYEFTERLGKGSMGEVYKAVQLSMERPVAVKLLSAQHIGNQTFIDRFFTEAKAVAKLNHPNIISGIDVGEHDKKYYFVMEYVDGTNLHKILNKEGPLPYERALDFTIQVAEALKHAYKNNIVHRDIKPDNIIITSEGTAKLCDLGLAKKATVGVGGKEKKTVGTPHYISPEQALGQEDIDVRADLYSLGASVFHMLTGRPPFVDGDALQLMKKHLNTPFPQISDFSNTDVPPQFLQVLDKMVAKDRNHRFQTPEELLEELKALQSGPGAATAGGAPMAGRSVSGRILASKVESDLPLVKVIGGIMAGAILIGLTVWLSSQGPELKKDSDDKDITKNSSSSWDTLGKDKKKDDSDKDGKSSSDSGGGKVKINRPTNGREKALQQEREAANAFRELRMYVIREVPPEAKVQRIQDFLTKYPQSSWNQQAQAFLVRYRSQMKNGGGTPDEKDPPKEDHKKLIAQLEKNLEDSLKKSHFTPAVKRLYNFLTQHQLKPWIGEVKSKVRGYEEKILAGMDKSLAAYMNSAKNKAKAQTFTVNFYKKIGAEGSEWFKGEVKKRLDELLIKQLASKYEAMEGEIFAHLRSWRFDQGQAVLDGYLKDPQNDPIKGKLQKLAPYIAQCRKGHGYIFRQLELIMNRKEKLTLPLENKPGRYCRIEAVDIKGDMVHLRWSGRSSILQKINLYELLPYLREFFLSKKNAYQPFNQHGLFLLFSGDFEGAGRLLGNSYNQLIAGEKGNLAANMPKTLGYRARRYGKNDAPIQARRMLLALKEKYGKSSFFTGQRKAHNQLYRQVSPQYYRRAGVQSILRPKVEKLEIQNKDFIRIHYDFEQKDLYKDWTVINKPIKSDLRLKSSSKSILFQGQLRHPVQFKGDIQVDVVAKVRSTSSDPANLCVFLNERPNPFRKYMIGLWFKIPGRGSLTIRSSRGNQGQWRAFPANAIVYFHNGWGNNRAHYIHNKPMLRSGKYRVSFYHTGDYLGARFKGRSSSFIRAKEKRDDDDHGHVSLFTANSFVRFYEVTITGKLNKGWWDKEVQRRAKQDIQSFVK